MELNRVINKDCIEAMQELPDNCIDTVITDPPYELNFMNKKWDGSGISFQVDLWKEVLRVAKPGAILLCFGGTRTYHRLACAIEDAGWVLKDCIMFLFGSGFPKSLNISKQIDKNSGAKREVVGNYEYPDGYKRKSNGKTRDIGYDNVAIKELNSHQINPLRTAPATDAAKLWDGYGTGLKPAYEPILIAMKPIDKNYANNALTWGVAGFNIDGGRIFVDPSDSTAIRFERIGDDYSYDTKSQDYSRCHFQQGVDTRKFGASLKDMVNKGRFPANVILDSESAAVLDEQSGNCRSSGIFNRNLKAKNNWTPKGEGCSDKMYGDKGGASRFFKNIDEPKGRYPANVIHDGSPEVLELFPETKSGGGKKGNVKDGIGMFGNGKAFETELVKPDSGSAARFFYTAKASKSERNAGCEGLEEKDVFKGKYIDNPVCKICGGSKIDRGSGVCKCKKPQWEVNDKGSKNNHPCVKPLKLLEYLCTLTKTPTGGIVLDPFAGSGTTGVACINTGRDFILIEKETEYCKIAECRLNACEEVLF